MIFAGAREVAAYLGISDSCLAAPGGRREELNGALLPAPVDIPYAVRNG
ncbi:hypothetical protein ACFWWB_39605 [Streptomyces sp. NPDC058690]